MSGFTTAAGISATTVTTTQQAPLGFQLTVPTANNGVQVYTYIRASVAIALGIVAARESVVATAAGVARAGYGTGILAVAAMGDLRYIGVAQQPVTAALPAGGIPAASYGFVLTQGIGSVQVNSASAAGDALVVHSASGEMDDAAATVTNGEMGVVLGDAILAGAIGNAYVNFPG